MKKVMILLLVVLSSYSAYSQNTFPESGNVGIGTISPAVPLHINKSPTAFTDVPMQRWDPSIAGYNLTLSNFNSVHGIDYRFTQLTNGVSTDVLTFQGGNVGIGTTTPLARLDVNSEAGNTTFRTSGTNGYMLINYVGSGESYYQANTAHRFQGTSSSEVFTILSGGNVGIGVVNPGEKLSVNGKIRAKEIKVEISPWPDYVFTKDYQLPTLQQTENHIKEKGHLPGIPSAAEVKANGIDLGEMNAKLLQKIEELTLYAIEQNKRLDSQQKILVEQQREIQAFKKQNNENHK